jgi:hypothetical protein
MFDDILEWLGDHIVHIFVVFGLLCLAGIFAEVSYDHDHPCLKEGPEKVEYYQKLGDIMVPVYGHACLERAR